MQLHFLCCTMLIIASKAFPNELHGSKLWPDFKERNLKFSSKIIQNRSLKFPLDFVPLAGHLPLHKVSIPTHLMCDTRKNLSLNSCRSKHVKRKISLKKSKSRIMKSKKIRMRRLSQLNLPTISTSSPKCFMYNFQDHRFPPLGLQDGYPIRHFDKFFGLVPDPKARLKVFVKNENQYLVCVDPPLFHKSSFKTKKNCSKVLNNRDEFKYSTSQRQCSNNYTNLVPKKKRSPIVSNSTHGGHIHKNLYKKPNSTRINKKLKSSNGTLTDLNSSKKKIRPSLHKKSFSSILEKSSPEFSMDMSRPHESDEEDDYSDSSEPSKKKDDDSASEENEKNEEKEEKQQQNSSSTVTRDLTKVHEILTEVKTMLEKYSEASDTPRHTDNHNDLYFLAKHDKKIKKKIDKAIPILIQISEELKDLSAHPERSKLSRQQKNKIKRKKKAKQKKALAKFKKKTRARYKKGKHSGKYGRDAENESSSDSGEPGCKADGTWWSPKTGVQITMSTKSNKMIKVNVNPTKYNRIIDSHWLMQGLTLTDHGGPFILAAIFPKKKKIASFVGQCKTCQGEDVIFGSWTISSCCHQCNEFAVSIETVLDVFKRKV